MRLVAPIALVAVMTMPLMTASGTPRHRPHRPPPPLARSLTVDEQEWSVIPSQTVVAAGVVTFRVYDRGQDPHDLVVKGPGGVRGMVSLVPGGSGTIVAHLRPGTYLLYCSMFMGTPQSHYARGMHATLTVR
jgi:heme/copper-type cytochrome/quinol oxidase subunit 2